MYKNMAEILHDAEAGDFKLSHFEVGEKDIMARINGIPKGEYVRLTYRGGCVMSDTPMEKRTNRQFLWNAHGKVLIGGLGIGMILLAIQDKEDVEQITVIEKHAEVIEIIQKQLPLNDKVTIVHADIFEYIPQSKYNTIYIDIWNCINEDVYENEMKPLIRRYRKYLVPKSEDEERYIDCWCKEEAKKGMRI